MIPDFFSFFRNFVGIWTSPGTFDVHRSVLEYHSFAGILLWMYVENKRNLGVTSPVMSRASRATSRIVPTILVVSV